MFAFIHLFTFVLPLVASTNFYLFLFLFFCFYLCPMFAYDSIFFCMPIFRLSLCVLLVVYVFFYLPLFIYLFLSSKF
jgi:hypothetical protein